MRRLKSGSLSLEILLALTIFAFTASVAMQALFSFAAAPAQNDTSQLVAVMAAQLFPAKLKAGPIDNVAELVSFGSSTQLLSARLKEAYGAETCARTFEADWTHPAFTNLFTFSTYLTPSDLWVRNGKAYLTFNSSSTTAPDIGIYYVTSSPAEIATTNTGPGIAAVTMAGQYVYAANTSANSQLHIYDVTGDTISTVSTLKIPAVGSSSPGFGRSIAYRDGFVYLGLTKNDGPELYRIDVSNVGTPVIAAQAETNTLVNAIALSSSTLYAATPNTEQLRMFDSGLVQKGSMAAPASAVQDGRSLYRLNDRLIFGRTVGGFNTAAPELYALDISTSSSVRLALDVASSVNGLLKRGTRIFLATTDPQKEFQIYDTGTGKIVASLDLPGKAVALRCDGENIYALTNDTNALVRISAP